jgi:peptide/nickel transport system ATP-binding protein/oligopeptide transport system ATP-binding protein
MDTVDEIVRFVSVSKTFEPRTAFAGKANPVHAVCDLTLSVRKGETLGLVGESGSGKTTTGRMLMRLEKPTSGQIWFDGKDVNALKGDDLREFRRNVQMVFQDSSQSLDSRMTVGDLVQEPLVALRLGDRRRRLERAKDSLAQVGLGGSTILDRYPGQLSGGQRQRVAIARALVVEPSLIVCDEPVTALDLSVQAQTLNLLGELQESRGLGLLFIAHDMSVIKQLAHRVAVMYRGHLVEIARAEEFFEAPAHPYSNALLEASLHDLGSVRRSREPARLGDQEPSAEGCVLVGRCWKTQDVCRATMPPLAKVSPLQAAACFFPEGAAETECVTAVHVKLER